VGQSSTLAPKRKLGDVSLDAGRASTQMGWYEFIARELAPGQEVLDSGCGLGVGLREIQRTAKRATGQELDTDLKAEGILIGPLSEIPDKSFDVVVAVDVVEHVPDDQDFIDDLARIARRTVFVTTPLRVLGRELWPYHIREYRAQELLGMFRSEGRITYYQGTPTGSEIYLVKNMTFFGLEDRLINNSMSNVPFRALQKLLPKRLRYNAHHAVRLDFV